MTDSQKRLDQMLSALRAQKFRITPQRMSVLKILSKSDDHPSVDRIYEQVKVNFPTTSLATVYKTISALKQTNQVLELGFSGSGSRYDGNKPYPHPHLICIQCGEITDPAIDEISYFSNNMEKQTGYVLVHQRLDFFGICPACQKKT